MPQRICGECTACCKTHPIVEIPKEAGVWCLYCNVGKGCSMYNNRPKGCRDFKCVWLNGMGPEESRPDKVHLVQDYMSMPGLGLVFMLFEVRGGALRSEFARELTQRHLGTGSVVFHSLVMGPNKIYLPDNFPPGPRPRRINNREVEIIPFSQCAF